jgi:hypothetical protein
VVVLDLQRIAVLARAGDRLSGFLVLADDRRRDFE